MDDVVELSSSAARHSCKVCGKGFPCGRSLGGHMRSHSPTEAAAAAAAGDDDADSDEDDDKIERRWMNGGVRFSVGGAAGAGGGGYELRENPKKTRRLSDYGDEDDGGDDRGDTERAVTNVRDWSEETTLMPGGIPAPKRRRRTMRVPAARDAIDNEPEDVALSLVMLSQDTGGLCDSTAAKEEYSSEKYTNGVSNGNSALFQYADEEITRSKKTKTTLMMSTGAGEKRSRYECPGCGRAFQSYQALGGHRASHKRINSNCSIAKVIVTDQPEPSVETNASFSTASTSAAPDVFDADDRAAAVEKAAKKSSKFECPICFKVFASGQALGGHKRSHSIAGELHERTNADSNAGNVQPKQSLLTKRFDLNLPAAGADD